MQLACRPLQPLSPLRMRHRNYLPDSNLCKATTASLMNMDTLVVHPVCCVSATCCSTPPCIYYTVVSKVLSTEVFYMMHLHNISCSLLHHYRTAEKGVRGFMPCHHVPWVSATCFLWSLTCDVDDPELFRPEPILCALVHKDLGFGGGVDRREYVIAFLEVAVGGRALR